MYKTVMFQHGKPQQEEIEWAESVDQAVNDMLELWLEGQGEPDEGHEVYLVVDESGRPVVSMCHHMHNPEIAIVTYLYSGQTVCYEVDYETGPKVIES